MKKLLGIVVLGLLWCNISFAQTSCTNYIDYDATYVDSSFNKSSAEEAWYMYYEFKSTSDKEIKISSLFLKTASGQEIIREKLTDTYIKPFGVRNSAIAIKQINKDVISKAGFSCRYETQQVSSNSTKQKKSTTNNWSRTNDKPKGNIWIWGGLATLFLVFVLWIGGLLDKQSIFITKNKDLKNKNISKISKNKSTQKNLIQQVWDGNETLSKTFWLYCILIGVIVSLISGVLMGLVSNIFFIIPVIYFVWSSIGLWNSSTKYQNSKLKLQQSYGWAIASKVYVALNLFTVFGQSILLFAN